MPNAIDWDLLALTHDYPNPVDMIADWYYNKDISVFNIAMKLGVSTNSLYNFMKKEKIKIRVDKDRQKNAWSKSMAFYVRSHKR